MKRKRCLVVGGTRGLGRALAGLWAGEGRSVTVVGRREPVGRLRGVETLLTDLRRPSDLGSAAARLLAKGPWSAVAFCQRFRGEGDDWAGEIETSLTATRSLIDALSPSFTAASPTSIVVVNSLVSRFVADDCGPGYHAVKGALAQLVRYYAVRLAPRARVNGVSPGLMLKDEARAFYRRRAPLRGLLSRIIPMGRMPKAVEVARAVDFLCSPGTQCITGQDLVVDGGMSLRYQPSLARQVAEPA